jgi:tetratricopeptide (TPR) repeat protein
VSFGTVGAVRGEEDLPPENWPLYDDEAEELAGELEAIEKQFPDGGNRFLLSAVVLEEFEQFAEAERMYTLALDNLPETPYFYDLVIDFYLKAEQYAKAEELWERKELSAVGD